MPLHCIVVILHEGVQVFPRNDARQRVILRIYNKQVSQVVRSEKLEGLGKFGEAGHLLRELDHVRSQID